MRFLQSFWINAPRTSWLRPTWSFHVFPAQGWLESFAHKGSSPPASSLHVSRSWVQILQQEPYEVICGILENELEGLDLDVATKHSKHRSWKRGDWVWDMGKYDRVITITSWTHSDPWLWQSQPLEWDQWFPQMCQLPSATQVRVLDRRGRKRVKLSSCICYHLLSVRCGGGKLGDVFEDFDPKAVAAASIAQAE